MGEMVIRYFTIGVKIVNGVGDPLRRVLQHIDRNTSQCCVHHMTIPHDDGGVWATFEVKGNVFQVNTVFKKIRRLSRGKPAFELPRHPICINLAVTPPAGFWQNRGDE